MPFQALRAIHATRSNCKGAKNLFAMQSFIEKLLGQIVFMEHNEVILNTLLC